MTYVVFSRSFLLGSNTVMTFPVAKTLSPLILFPWETGIHFCLWNADVGFQGGIF